MACDLKPGQIVRTLSGRDCGRLMAVVGFSGDFALLADGDLRKTGRPKKKNVRHIAKTDKIIDNIDSILSVKGSADATLKAAIEKNFNSPEGKI